MRTIALLRPQTAELVCRRVSIGRDGTRLIAQNGRQIEPAIVTLNDHRSHHLALLPSNRQVSDRVKGRRVRRHTPSASTKSP